MNKPKILFGIQATGNGHLSRAKELIPVLKEFSDLDILLSGIQGDLNIDHPIKYSFHGVSFIFGKNGGIDYIKTAQNLKLITLFRDIKNLPVREYDLIIQDFEPISSWAAKLKSKKCVTISHQAAFISSKVPRSNKPGFFAELLFKYFAPSDDYIGLHFDKYDEKITTPIIRQSIRNAEIKTLDHIIVYLPFYGDSTILKVLEQCKNNHWIVYSKHSNQTYTHNNITIHPVGTSSWESDFAHCKAAIIGAGFTGVSEALFLQKKLMVIPMQGQYEQHCNAEALKKMGVFVSNEFNSNTINQWLSTNNIIQIDFQDQREFFKAWILSHL